MRVFKDLLQRRRRCTFWSKDDGAVLTEALVAVPFVTLFAVGILEFGNIFWERMQIDAGLRDAGRYLARCRPQSGTYKPTCDRATARTIALFGTQSPADDAKPRVPGWKDPSDIVILPAENADGTIDISSGDTLTVSTSHLYEASPLFGWLGIDAITISVSHEERYMGW